MRSPWGAIANPHAQVFNPPAPSQYVLYLLFVRTHTKFGIKVFEIYIIIQML